MLRLHRLIEPEGFWVADDAGQIVGTVGAVDYGRLAYIALMTVEPGRQSQGLGRRLMEHALAWLGQRGCHVVLLDATEKGARLYQTMGFVDDAFAYEFVREQVASPPTANGHRIERAMAGDLPTIVAFDAPRFGAGRQKLFAALWPTLGERALVARDASGQLAGYLLARDSVLGPWAAGSSEAAEDLLVAALGLPHRQQPVVMLPRSNARAIELLSRHGFVERRRLRHMHKEAKASRACLRTFLARPASGTGDATRIGICRKRPDGYTGPRMSTPYEPPPEYEAPRRRSIWPLVLLGCAGTFVVVIAACAGFLYFGYRQVAGGGEVAREVDRFFEDIDAGRAAEFYRSATSAEFKRATSEKQFLEIATATRERLGKLQSKTATGFNVRSQNLTTTVEAAYDCHFERGRASVNVRFQHEGDRWLLQHFRVDSPRLTKAAAREE